MIYNAVDIDDWSVRNEPPTSSHVVVVGRLIPVKQVDLAIHAIALLPNYVQLDVVGEGPQRSSLEQLAADLNALGPAMQQRFHHQGFGGAPVDDILARIEDRLPAIA